ncbi:CBS domain-containing protein [Caenimonas sp. SL110]|uniref:CBS domain-containing protein n=1 Tax=Caenimonas sp. SL110 TaxID=1450524 RepID=UPI0006541258|nr:CBS domain-containing protein [Caenimonas sp. SL110]
MTLADLCRPQALVSLSSTATLREAVAAMRENGVSAVAVMDALTPERLIGVLSERDLFNALLRDPATETDRPATPPPEHPGYIKRNEP